jgi:hypothetical protein
LDLFKARNKPCHKEKEKEKEIKKKKKKKTQSKTHFAQHLQLPLSTKDPLHFFHVSLSHRTPPFPPSLTSTTNIQLNPPMPPLEDKSIAHHQPATLQERKMYVLLMWSFVYQNISIIKLTTRNRMNPYRIGLC